METELEEYGDIVFVREKTNYKSILFKTFYVSSGGAGDRWPAGMWLLLLLLRAGSPAPCKPNSV